MGILDIQINKDPFRDCSTVVMPDIPDDYGIGDLATKLQKEGFIIKKVIKDGYVQEYSEDLDQTTMDNIESVILEFEYLDATYICEIGEEKMVIRPAFTSEDFLKKKLYECIVNPTSVFLQTAVENIESAEMNLSIGNIRSASSDIYYSVHNLLKSIQFNYKNDEEILTSDTHPPLFLANIQPENESDEEYKNKLKQSFNSQLGRIKSWFDTINPALVKFEDELEQKNISLETFKTKLDDLKSNILKECKDRAGYEDPDYNFYKYLEAIEKKNEKLGNSVSGLGNLIQVLIISTYESRVLGDYKFNFESMLSKRYITLLFWFAEEFIKFTKFKSLPRIYRNRGNNQNKLSELHIVTNKKANDSILGVIRISDSNFDPVKVLNRIYSELFNSISIIDWEKKYPIKLNVLELSQAPISIEIHDNFQIDIYTPFNTEKQSIDIQLKYIEDLVQKIHEFIITDYPNAQVKVSPITVSYQHRLIKKASELSNSPFYAQKKNIETHLSSILTKSSGNIKTKFIDITLTLDGEKTNFIITDMRGTVMRTMRTFSDLLGNTVIRRQRLSSDKTVIITNDITINQLKDNNLLNLLSEVKAEVVSLPIDLWEKLSLTDIEQKDLNLIENVLFNQLNKSVVKEIASTDE